MRNNPGLPRHAGWFAGLALSLLVPVPAGAQTLLHDFVTGDAAAAWAKWQPAMQAILDRNPEQAERFFAELLEQDPSAFRIALLAERTVERTALAGAVLLLDQDYKNDALEVAGKRVAELLKAGREQQNQADDGWYFCSVGRFDVSQANFQTLLRSDPDPVALLEFTDQIRKRREILIQLTDNPVVGDSVRAILKLLDRGEEIIKADPTRIKANIERLGGPPRAYENAVAWLKQSGEYAIPFLVQSLLDPEQRHLTQAIKRCLPEIDRPALNPLVVALRVGDPVTKGYLIEAAGQIGYAQAIPYLLQLQNSDLPDEITTAIDQALARCISRGRGAGNYVNASAPEAFFAVAEAYYDDQPSLAADPRLDTANVWYWRDGLLQNVEVPTRVFNEIMCLRCCEEALLLDSNMKKAQALWVAANFRREAQLRIDETDRTRPENYPSAAYFAQTSGPDVCLMTLARALDDGDPVVALGCIQALRNIAGPASVVGDERGRLPLAEALSFPDRMVRIRAALALGNARPTRPFQNYQNLLPVLSEALMLFGGGRNALVIDTDTDSANQVAAALRGQGYEVVTDAEFLRGLQKIRQEFPSLDVIFVASDVQDTALTDALRQLRNEFRFAATPVVIIGKPGDRELVRGLIRADHRLGELLPGESEERITAVVDKVSRAVGVKSITADVGTGLALQAAQTLHALAETNNPLFSVADTQTALIAALSSTNPELRITIAQVLGHLCVPQSQEALAKIALDPTEPQEMRVDMFAALAEAAKHCANCLGPESVGRIVAVAEADEDLVIRTAASQTLGALNLPANTGSEIIRNQYGG